MLKGFKLGFSHLREHKFIHAFKDTLNPLCYGSIEAKTTTQYFLRCHFYNSNRGNLMNNLENIPISFFKVSDNNLISLLLNRDDRFADTKNQKILKSTIRITKDSQRFDEQVFR